MCNRGGLFDLFAGILNTHKCVQYATAPSIARLARVRQLDRLQSRHNRDNTTIAAMKRQATSQDSIFILAHTHSLTLRLVMNAVPTSSGTSIYTHAHHITKIPLGACMCVCPPNARTEPRESVMAGNFVRCERDAAQLSTIARDDCALDQH